ncbi:hypothetical protein GCM10027570_23900 [Streptomonospora sediminis]
MPVSPSDPAVGRFPGGGQAASGAAACPSAPTAGTGRPAPARGPGTQPGPCPPAPATIALPGPGPADAAYPADQAGPSGKADQADEADQVGLVGQAAPAASSASAVFETLPGLLEYYRSCLRRESVLIAECPLPSETAPATGAGPVPLAAGSEPLFSGAETAPFLPPAAEPLVRAAARRDGALRYGYPLVVLPPRGGDRTDRAAPLLVADIEAIDCGSGRGGGLRMRALSRADINPALLRALGIDSAPEVAELRRWLRRGAPGGSGPSPAGAPGAGTAGRPVSAAVVAPRPRGRHARRSRPPGESVPCDLEHTVRALLVRLGIERVDPILPSRLRDTLPTAGAAPGARNVAVVYPAAGGPAAAGRQPAECGGGGTAANPTGLVTDIDPRIAGGLAAGEAAATALGALLGTAGRADAEGGPGAATAVPVSATKLDEARYRIVRAALEEPLTLAAAAPGTGGSELVDTVVRTAAAAGKRVLVGGGDDRVLDRIARRAGRPPGHTVMRAGGPDHRAAEARILERLRGRAAHGAGSPESAGAAGIGGLPAEARRDWSRVEDAWRAMDSAAAAGHTLTRLAGERRSMADSGWHPDHLFDPQRGGPEHWLDRAQRALAGGLSGAKHRAAIRRDLGIKTSPENLRRLRWAAQVECDWHAALGRRGHTATLDRLTADLESALNRHRESAALLADSAAAERIAGARAALKNRAESLNWYDSAAAAGTGEPVGPAGACPGFARLLGGLPVWAVSTASTRSVPDRAALFDLAVVVDADRLTVPELVPLLYRAKRALVIGDPARPVLWSALEPDEDRRRRDEAGLASSWLEERALTYTRHSAYDAVAAAVSAAGRAPFWLEEHRRCHPEIAGAAARHCYGGRFAVLTRPAVLPAGSGAGGSGGACTEPESEPEPGPNPVPGDGGPARGAAVEWRHGTDECEPVPGGVCLNRGEAHRAVSVVQKLDPQLPARTRLGVFAPVQPQRALLRRLLELRGLEREVGVHGPLDLLDDEDDTVDVLVVSAVCSGARLPEGLLQRVRAPETWSGALGRTAERLVVVGDRAFWRGERGPLAELARSPEACAEPVAETAAIRTLVRVLRASGTGVQTGAYVHGYRADLRVRTPHGHLLVLVDQSRTGADLRRLTARRDLLARLSGEPVARIPAWRCLHEPEALAGELRSRAPGARD